MACKTPLSCYNKSFSIIRINEFNSNGKISVKAFLAIVLQTIRSAIRSKVFHVLFVFILLSVFLLPMTVSGDGTAIGLVQIALTYSLGIVVALISTTTLWLGCSLLSHEIENYSVHMVVVKPCPRWMLWLGKWCGVFIMHAIIMLISGGIIYGLTQWRVAHGDFSELEISQLNKEIRVGRRSFEAEQPNIEHEVEAEFEKNKESFGKDLSPSATKTIKEELRRRVLARQGEVAPGTFKVWTFKNVTSKLNEKLANNNSPEKSANTPLETGMVFFRYRLFSGEADSTKQQQMPCIWGVRDPRAVAGGAPDPYINSMLNVMGGTYQELIISSNFIDKNNDNSLAIRFYNPPKEGWNGHEPIPAVFQPMDGPTVLVAVVGFANNYFRAMLLALLQIAFLAALGCTVSAAFSTPVATFVAVAYLVIGLSVQAAVSAPSRNEDGSYRYTGVANMLSHKFSQGIGHIVVSVDDLDATSDLIKGRLIEGRRLGESFLYLFCLRTGLIAVVGIWILNKRELGAVIRK